jgi:viroplasmin and RNaseH domain-containing protein
VTAKAKVGYYKTVAARKYLGGVESTYLSEEAFNEREKERRAKGNEEIQEAIGFIQGSSSANSEERAYEEALGYNSEKSVKMEGKPNLFGKKDDGEKKNTPTKIDSGGTDGVNKLLASPTMMEIAKVGKAKAGMMGLMDKLAGAVVATTERLKTLEQTQAVSTVMDESDKTSEQLARMTSVMTRMMERMEMLEGATEKVHHLKSAPAMVTPNKSLTKYWYGVGKGREGSKVYTDWGETARAVNGLSGAIYQRFNSATEAREFVEKSLEADSRTTLANMYGVFNMNTGLKGIYHNWKEVSDVFNGVKGAKAKKFHTLEEAQIWLEAQQEVYDEQRHHGRLRAAKQEQGVLMEGVRRGTETLKESKQLSYQSGPPGDLLGADPSLKNGEKVYGVDVSVGEAELRAALCPPGMTETVAKGLTNAMIDVAALPGGFANGGVDEANKSDLNFIGAALE